MNICLNTQFTYLMVSKPKETSHGFHDLLPKIARDVKCIRGCTMKAISPIILIALNFEKVFPCRKVFISAFAHVSA